MFRWNPSGAADHPTAVEKDMLRVGCGKRVSLLAAILAGAAAGFLFTNLAQAAGPRGGGGGGFHGGGGGFHGGGGGFHGGGGGFHGGAGHPCRWGWLPRRRRWFARRRFSRRRRRHSGGDRMGAVSCLSRCAGQAAAAISARALPTQLRRSRNARGGNPGPSGLVAGNRTANATPSQPRDAAQRQRRRPLAILARIRAALRAPGGLRNPAARAAITAAAAGAVWSHHNGGLWWRHAHGGFGWVGPVFWPYAYYDLYDYAWWGGGYDPFFWDYGYGDLYAGLFGPYDYDALSGYADYLPGYTGSAGPRLRPAPDTTATLPTCAAVTAGISRAFPIDQFRDSHSAQ